MARATGRDSLAGAAQHAIVLFPAFDAADEIEAVRRAYDPQSSVLPAHVTLVFPFTDANAASFLLDHIATSLAGMPPFDIAVATPTPEDGGYLFLRVTEGRDRVVELHDRLYTGPLLAHRSATHSYEPHVTVGRLGSPEALRTAASAARLRLPSPAHARIHEVSLFQLGAGLHGVVATFPLEAR
jgi:2'-5' RNA ligase